ncbi:hypothetical protein ThidrDRAFT_4477, partial [Thiorhodococcus drewsii AZ1]
RTYSNKGLALKALGSPQALNQAIAAYDRAITLRETLDLGVAEYANDLAGTYSNKGLALKALGSPQALQQAIAAYERAIALGESLDLGVAEYANALALAYGNKAFTLLAVPDPMPAEDAAETGLALLRDVELGGIYHLRPTREGLFSLTLDAYLAAGQAHFLPEIILEHLDPDSHGSAPASAAMQRAALAALERAMAQLLREPGGAERAQALVPTAQRLAELRVLYFGGTATSALLQAEDFKRRGDPQQAEQVLRNYVRARPSDPEGHLVLAGFLARHWSFESAEASYQRAAAVLVQQAPADADRQDVARRVGQVASLMLELKEIGETIHLPPTTDPKEVLKRSLKRVLWLTDEFMSQLFIPLDGARGRFSGSTEDWRDAIKPSLKTEVWPSFIIRNEALIQRCVEASTAEAQETIRDEYLAMHRAMTEVLIRGLTTRWDGFAEAIQHAWTELAAHYQHEWLAGDAQTQAEIERKLDEGLARAVAEANRSLSESELAEARSELAQRLGPIWDQILQDTERCFLACGRRCLGQENLARYAGLELGLAVEWSLARRLFHPVREHWRAESRGEAESLFGEEAIAAQVARFLDGKKADLELGPMVAALQRTLKHGEESADPLDRLLGTVLRQALPNPDALLAPASRRRRAQALESLRTLRNDCAHPKEPPTRERLATHWKEIVEDPDEAFYQYFGRALLPRETPPAEDVGRAASSMRSGQ